MKQYQFRPVRTNRLYWPNTPNYVLEQMFAQLTGLKNKVTRKQNKQTNKQTTTTTTTTTTTHTHTQQNKQTHTHTHKTTTTTNKNNNNNNKNAAATYVSHTALSDGYLSWYSNSFQVSSESQFSVILNWDKTFACTKAAANALTSVSVVLEQGMSWLHSPNRSRPSFDSVVHLEIRQLRSSTDTRGAVQNTVLPN